MGTRGVWSLENVEIKKPQDDWVDIPNVWVKETVTKPNAGWIGGGNYKKLDKIAFDTDTRTDYGYNWSWPNPTTFNAGGNRAAGTAAATHGYFAGGTNNPGWPSPAYTSYMTKLVYATGSPLTSPTNTISANRSFHVGVSADEYGYLLGGSTYPSSLPYDSTSDTKLSIVDKITNSTDTAARVPAADLPSAQTKKAMCASAATPSFAYMSGGITPIVSTAARFTYSTETVTQTPSANNLTARSYHTSSSNGSTNFYWHGGGTTNKTIADATPANNYMTNTKEKTVIATDTTSAIPATGDTGYCARTTTGNSTHAYTFNGGTPYGLTWQSEKMTYSNETSASLPSGVRLQASYGSVDISPVKGLSPSGLTGEIVRWFDEESSNPNYGYSVSGRNAPSPNQNSTAYKIDFSTDGNSAAPGVNNYIAANHVFGAGSTTNGYIMGGTDFSPSDGESQVTKVTYSTETRSNLGASHLGAKRYACYAMTYGNSALYVLGGRGPEKSDCRKMTYSNDTISGVPSNANLSAAKYAGSSVATSTAGYMIGGSPNGVNVITSVDKITFSSDTTARIPSADISTGLKASKGLSESTAGYSVGGSTWPSTYSVIQKLTFANETSETISPTLPRNTREMQTLGTDTKGYVVGGNPGYYSSVDKFVYATSTLSALDNLPTGQSVGQGISPGSDNLPFNQRPEATPTSSTTNLGIPEHGYIAGGFGNVSSISKLDMASETYTRLTTSLSETNRRLGGFGDLTKGYAAAGTQPVRSWCQKLVYSTETRTTLPSQMQSARGYLRAIGNNTAGYVGGGTPQSTQGTKMDKMPYSTETFSSLPNIPTSRYRYASLGNQTQGYFAGGYPNAMSKVTKITYSNDSYATTPTISYSATFQTGAGNATKGYVVSGEGGGTKVDKITFSNDTTARVPSADLSAVRYAMDGNNSPTKAYFTGGSPGVKTNTEVITFSNDTTALSSTANADTGDNQAGAYAAFGPNHCGNPGSDIHPNVI